MNITSLNKLITLATRVINPKKSTEPIYKTAPQKNSYEKTYPSSPLERSTPEKEGIKSSLIKDLLEKIFNDKRVNLHGVMIIRHDKVICEATYGGYSFNYHRLTYSQCKSITSLAIGCLIDEGKLTLDTKVIDIFPKLTLPIAKIKLKKLTVEDLLTMRSSIEFMELDSLVEQNWKKAFINSSTKGEIGKTFNYNSLNTYMLASIVNEVTGLSLSDYLDKRIFTQLDIKDYYWEKSPEGIEKGGWGLYMLPEDIAKLAILVMNKGKYNGKKIISASYINEAIRAHAEAPLSAGRFNYGYQIWCGRDRNTFLFNGMFGQNALGFLDNDIIVMTMGGNDETFQSGAYYDYIIDCFDAIFEDTLPEDKKEQKELSDYLSELKIPYKKYIQKTKVPIFGRLFGKKRSEIPHECLLLDRSDFIADDSDAPSCGFMPMVMQIVTGRYTKGITSICFDCAKNGFYITYNEKDEHYRFEIGFGKYVYTELNIKGEPYHICCNGRFAKNEYGVTVLLVRVDFLEIPSTRHMKFVFDDTVFLEQYETPGGDYLAKVIVDAKHDMAAIPAIGSSIDKLDDEYLRYKIARVFSPNIKLNKKN